MNIIDEVLKNYFYCKLKAYYKYINMNISNKSFYYFEIFLRKYTNRLFIKSTKIKKFDNINNCQVGCIYSISTTLNLSIYTLQYDYIEITNDKFVTPIFISGNLKARKEEKEFCAYKSKLLELYIDKEIHYFKIILHSGLTQKVKVKNGLVINSQNIIDKNSTIIKKIHCNICEYAFICTNKLKEDDDIRLLSSIPETQVQKLNNIGYFTVKQYSYSYKPRRSSLIISSKSRYKFELKSLAIRNNKTYIAEDIILNHQDIEIFIDFETLPSESYVYLIGVVIVKKDKIISKLSFWADSYKEEQKIFEELFRIIKSIGSCTIYHYGSFEIKELTKFNKKHNNIYTSEINNIIDNSINILNYFYSNIYPPTYSNGLKDIANFIGFDWSKKYASGLLSIVWRKRWDFKKSAKLQNRLILYNIEDCIALFYVKKWIEKLKNGKEASEDLNQLFQHSGFKFGKTKFNIDTFEHINKTSYFDYQTKKIFIRDTEYKHAVKKLAKKNYITIKENTVEYTTVPDYCTNCLNEKMYKHEKYIRYIIDLKFTKNGIKKWVIKYHDGRYRCSKCNKTITPSKYKEGKYGRNLKIWIIYQIFVFNISYRDIEKMLNDIFNIQMTSTSILNIKKNYSLHISKEYENILKDITDGDLLHIDETTVTLGKKKHYVWVLTNLTKIYYIYRDDRTSDFLIDIFKNFKGVMISDFYTAYDRLEVNQQKCLIHLMRDVNDLIFKNQEDLDLIYIAQLYGNLLNKIVKTIDKYGLKKRNLNKHKKDVIQFYNKVDKYTFVSDDSIKLKKRFTKYKSKLFTFLDFDGIPWNNNNAEHAIKEFAKYRHKTNGFYTENSLQDYLKILSIKQSCTYQNIKFLDYLKVNFP